MRKIVYVICEQQNCRSACASAQSDQQLWCSLPRKYNISSFYIRNVKPLLASVADQSGLSLTLSETPKTGFLVTRFNGGCRVSFDPMLEDRYLHILCVPSIFLDTNIVPSDLNEPLMTCQSGI